MENPIIFLEAVSKKYQNQTAVDEVTLEIKKGEFLTVIGTSGCGKTTVLKLINGLLTPDSGKVYVKGQDISTVDQIKLRRNIGYAIQGTGLFPHMTVQKNIAYVPSLSHAWDKKTEEEKTKSLLLSVGLSPELKNRYPLELSGGQKQRVGIARALAAQPEILLMDEPFGAVDEITRRALQDELLKIQKSLQITIVFVTHDIREALKLGTTIAVMDKGKIVQLAPPKEIKEHPGTEFVKNLVQSEF